MPMSPTAMAAALQPAILTTLTAASPMSTPAALASALATAIATARVPYLSANVVVTGTATGAVAGGPGVPVVGTIS